MIWVVVLHLHHAATLGHSMWCLAGAWPHARVQQGGLGALCTAADGWLAGPSPCGGALMAVGVGAGLPVYSRKVAGACVLSELDCLSQRVSFTISDVYMMPSCSSEAARDLLSHR